VLISTNVTKPTRRRTIDMQIIHVEEYRPENTPSPQKQRIVDFSSLLLCFSSKTRCVCAVLSCLPWIYLRKIRRMRFEDENDF